MMFKKTLIYIGGPTASGKTDLGIQLAKNFNTEIEFVAVDSAVVRPGIYESVPGETIKQILTYAGGKKHNSSDIIGVKRIQKVEEKFNQRTNYNAFYTNYLESENIEVQNGDNIIVQYIANELMEVKLIGQVKKPGNYFYYDGMMLTDLINLGSGFEDSTFRKTVFFNSAELIRRMPDEKYDKALDYINEGLKIENSKRF